MASSHDGIRRASEQEAVLLFELPEVQEAADTVATCFRAADVLSAQADELRRQGAATHLEVDAKRRAAAATTQAQGGRLHHVGANELAADANTLVLQAAITTNDSERKTLEGERGWAELAAKHGAYIPHGRRLEVRSAEHPGKVFCYDVDEGEVALHDEGLCPACTLRHDRNSQMLRRRESHGKLGLWPGRREY